MSTRFHIVRVREDTYRKIREQAPSYYSVSDILEAMLSSRKSKESIF